MNPADLPAEQLAEAMDGEAVRPVSISARAIACITSAPQSVQGLLRRVFMHAAPPSQAIKARCLQCANFERAEITACRTVDCALHAYRPFQHK